MNLASRTGAWSDKPLPYLRRVAYLESDGQQYIDTLVDTGVDFVNDNIVEIDFLPRIISDTHNFFGNGSSWISGYTLSVMYSGGKYYAQASNGFFASNNSAVVVVGDWNTVVASNLGVKYNGIDLSYQYPSNPVSGTALLFGCRRNGSYFREYTLKGGIRKAVIMCKGNLVRNFIPVLDLSGRPTMYDEVSGQLFYNQGTGEFTWGELQNHLTLAKTTIETTHG